MENKSNSRGGMPEVGSIDWFKRYFWTINPVGTREGDDYTGYRVHLVGNFPPMAVTT